MYFTSLTLANVGVYAGQQTIDLEPTNDSPIILFGGMNGGGKTTLLEAIRLALYGSRSPGRNSRAYASYLADLIHRPRQNQPLNTASVELGLQFILDEIPTNIRLCRSWDTSGKETLTVLRQAGSSFWPDHALTQTWDERIETLFPLGISNLFLFDGEQVKELAEQDTFPPAVIDAIRSVLGLHLASRLTTDLDVLLQRKRKELAQSKLDSHIAQRINTLESEITLKQQQLDLVNQELHNLYETKLKLESELHEIEQRFIVEGANISANLGYIKTKKQKIANDIAQEHTRLICLADTSLPLLLIQNLLESALYQAQKEQTVEQTRHGYTLLGARREKALNFLKLNNLDPQLLDQFLAFWEQENQELEKTINSIEPWLEATPDIIPTLSFLLNQELPRLHNETQNSLHTLNALAEECNAIEAQETLAAPHEWHELLTTERNQKLQDLSLIEQQINTAIHQQQQFERDLHAQKKELSQYLEQHIAENENHHILGSIHSAQKTLALFTERLTSKKLARLENHVTECYRYLLHKTNFVHRITIDPQTFTLQLYNEESELIPKHRLSAGEKQLLAVAILWGLARTSERNLPVVIDTPLGRLDSSHRNHLVQRYFPNASQQVIILSTDTEITRDYLDFLRTNHKIAKEYRLNFDCNYNKTIIENGYFY